MKNLGKTIKKELLAMLLIGVSLLLVSQLVAATPHPGQSVNVVIIGGTTLDTACSFGNATNANVMTFTGGGCLPVVGPIGELGDFTFTPMHPSAVSAANLTSFDTAVLNVASSAMACNTSTLAAQQRADLVAFVGGGKKLIIFDSECFPGPVNYSWMPYPFTTANPGALGAQGTLTIVEENTLSSTNLADPHFINATNLSNFTDAVGDMNVMTTFDPNWCVDMSGTNAIGITGPVHTYAKYPVGTDLGLFIYNGLDQDYQYNFSGLNNPWIRKIWVQELQQPFNPSNLPCGVTVVGITLTPPNATNEVGQTHTVTAKITDLLGNPQPGISVTFSIISGPNSPFNASGTTNASGQASFTYSGTGGVGTDEIKACFTNQAGQVACSQVVIKEWITPTKLIEGRMSGGGSVFNDSLRVTHGFELNCNASKVPNNLQVNWGKGNKFHLETLTAASCTDNPAIAPNPPAAGFDTYKGSGTGRFNGVSDSTAEWTFTDAGEPGNNDFAKIVIKDVNGNVVLMVSGNLTRGNHQAHKQ